MYTTAAQVAEGRAAEEAALLPDFAMKNGLDYDDEDWPEDKQREFSKLANALTKKWNARMEAVS